MQNQVHVCPHVKELHKLLFWQTINITEYQSISFEKASKLHQNILIVKKVHTYRTHIGSL